MVSRLRDSLAQQLRLPSKGIMGRVALQIFNSRNKILEKNAPRLCGIEPHHKVLEIGFGPGIGIQHALKYVTDGPGKIYGIEASSYMIEKASERLRTPIRNKKVELSFGSVMALPYGTDTFHRVFHCNCYYFWPSMQGALQEIYRVMKPGAHMVTVISISNIKKTVSRGFMKYGAPDLIKYMTALELTGFSDVRIEYYSENSTDYQAVFAYIPSKPAVDYDLLSGEEMVCDDSLVGASSKSRDDHFSSQNHPSTSRNDS